MTIRTIGFLPEVFRSSTNQKFLNATIDQLVTEPSFKKINGYVGRKFAPTYKAGDNYVIEPTTDRQDYQLEPCVVVKDLQKNINFFSSYADVIQQIQHYGGVTNNHSRLFDNTAYTFNGLVDFDKLVNFSQYYWLPNGPSPVDVFATEIDTTNTFTITRDALLSAYTVSEFGTAQNPDIILARGGTYQFIVNQPGNKFWIQTDPGLTGKQRYHQTIDGREVYGVEDNGSDNGIVIFNVPQSDAQDDYINMPLVGPIILATVDGIETVSIGAIHLATTLKFSDIDHQLVANVVKKFGGIDGEVNDLNGKYIVFISNDNSDDAWHEDGVYALDNWGLDGTPLDDGTTIPLRPYDDSDTIPTSRRGGVWQIKIQDTGGGDELIHLVWFADVPVGHRVLVSSGNTYADMGFYKTTMGEFAKVPLLTANVDTLYYNDGTDQRFYGRIRLVDLNDYKINITTEIIGQQQYTSPNGVVFTNGLKVRFGIAVLPSIYADTEYYVEGVGTSIRLVKAANLITPELNFDGTTIPFDIYGFDDDFFDQLLNGPQTPDYITINRSSVDLNAWSRSNRWFHEDVIQKTADYNNELSLFDQTLRATRPIIEINADYKLINYGQIARPDVDILDFSITDAATMIEGSVVDFTDTTPHDGKDDYVTYFEAAHFKDGMNVIFVNDFDPTIRNKIFKLHVLDIYHHDTDTTVKTVHMTKVEGGDIRLNDVVIPKIGATVNLEPASNPNFTMTPSARKIKLSDGLGDQPIDGIVNENVGLLLGNVFWFNGSDWVYSQQKTSRNSAPLFDMIDDNNISFADQAYYYNSSFKGCKIFSYKPGTGANDKVLGFPLSYRNFNNIGDIEFQNDFDTDTFTELVNLTTIKHNINTGFAAKIIDYQTLAKTNIWDTKVENTKQYQIISAVADGIADMFHIDIRPDQGSLIPNIKVYINNKLFSRENYRIVQVGVNLGVQLSIIPKQGDKVDILIYSTEVSALGYYEVPSNLDFNALNKNFPTLTLGQFRNHLTTLAQNTTTVIGQVPGFSNIRDLDIKAYGGSILQHSAPTIYGSLFLTNKEVSFVDSITLAQQEYSKFKNRFLESFSSVVNAGLTNNPAAAVDYVIHNLNYVKSNQSPWYYSDMLPYDQNKSIIEYTIIDAELVEYEIDTIFNDTVLSNKAVLVYVNGVQLIKGIDYTFNQTRPSIVFMNPFQYDDVLQVHVYHNTDGCFIPETPTKLGLYPRFTPEILLDSTYQTPITVLRGHDGSITPTFNDFRDEMLLEFEKRIYNNIKVPYTAIDFDIYKYIPGKFRTTDYTKAEFDHIVSRNFLVWIGNNRVDFSTNHWFQSSNPWSWTYSRFHDIVDNEWLPGYWKGIYKYFFDTDAPNERPWESLGFSERPDWWVDTYGPAPYTGGNLVLWGDLETGTIQKGDRAGTWPQYARPGLSKVIPVTESGELKPPSEFITNDFNSNDASGAFKVGDQAPIETAWIRSSDYPFAVQQALALMKPALYFGRLSNIQDYATDNGVSQFIIKNTKQRITPSDFKVNGETVSGSIVRNAGYLNWIVDYITNNGADPVTVVHSYLDYINVQLGYKVAGYTDQTYLKILAEQGSPTSTNESVIIPDENYQVHLHKSSPVDRVVYSAVIIEKTTGGYSVSGYDSRHPYFTIIPSDPNSNQSQLLVSGATGIVYNNYQKIRVSVPYGYEFMNKQQVVDFLISYGRQLQSIGFSFEDFSRELQDTRNWELSAKEFLTWTQQGWEPGNMIVVSPVLNQINLTYNNAVVDVIDSIPAGSKILDVGFNVVTSSMFNVVRDNANFTLTALPEITIALIDLNLVQYEHALVFDNETVFNDIIYKPELGNRQFRLKLIGNKTNQWTGQVNPPGFIFSSPTLNEWQSGRDYRKGDIVLYKNNTYTALVNIDAIDTFNYGLWKQIDQRSIKSGLLPNFAYNASKSQYMYDVDSQVQDQNLNLYSNGLIGYRERNYLVDLNLNPTSQVKFYQGYIKDKGTKDAVNALSYATFSNLSGNITFNEEWGFRVGEYGALETNQFVEVQLSDSKYTYNPIAVELLNVGEVSADQGVVGEYKHTLYKKPIQFNKNIFNNRNESSIYEDDIETAGYVNLNDIDATLFDMQDYTSLGKIVANVYAGFKIWVAKDTTRDWNVYRVDETDVIVTNMLYELDGYASLTTNYPHHLKAGDKFIVRHFSSQVDSFYSVVRTDSLITMVVAISPVTEAVLLKTPSLDGTGSMFILESLRFNHITDIKNQAPRYGWKETDKVWIDNANTTQQWEVYSKNTPWNFSTEIPGLGYAISLEDNARYGQAVAISPNGDIVVITSPGSTQNNVTMLLKDNQNSYNPASNVTVTAVPGVVFGNAVGLSQHTIVIDGAGPTSNQSRLMIYSLKDGAAQEDIIFDNSRGDLGKAIAISSDDQWLFASAPADGTVHCYKNQTSPGEIGIIISAQNIVAGKTYVITYVSEPPYDVTDFMSIGAASNTVGETFVATGPTTGGGWVRLVKFVYVDTITAGPSIKFGDSISTNNDGSLLAVGIPDYDYLGVVNTGLVFMYQRTGDVWSFKQEIQPPELIIYENFGFSVCLSADKLFVGAPNWTEGQYKSGVVYQYEINATSGLYSLKNIIKKPYADNIERFGTTIAASQATNTVLIGSQGAYSMNETLFDKSTLVFDGDSTIFIDKILNSGAVYVYDLIGDQANNSYEFNQQLGLAMIRPGDNFGNSIALNRDVAIVGSPLNDIHNTDAGKVQLFTNPTLATGWSLTRQRDDKVDLDNINRIFIYDRKAETILATLDYIDPAKGKILGVAEQDIEYKTSFDPANYNVGTNPKVAVDTSYHWGEAHVGQVWWNLDKIRYIDYEQGSLTYRIKNWGRLFPGADVEIAEWIQSTTLPSNYTGDGIPLYPDDSAYAQESKVDTDGVIRTKYYFWVRDKTTVDIALPFRRSSVSIIADLIRSPAAQNIPYATVLKTNAVALVNCNNYISDSNTILHLDYATTQNSNIIHNEYELVQENSNLSVIPNKILNKLVDSLTGADTFGNPVPDYSLTTAERYGVSIRPRQTMFVNKNTAVENFVQYVNSIFKQYAIAEEFDLATLYLAEPAPTVWDQTGKNVIVETLEERSYLNTADLDATKYPVIVPKDLSKPYGETITQYQSQRILVMHDSDFDNEWAVYEVQTIVGNVVTYKLIRTQSYKTQDYWSKVDWFDSTYDPTIKPTYTVETEKDIAKLSIVAGTVVRVKNNGANQFIVYRFDTATTKTLVGVENGTIQLSNALWAHDTHKIGFDNDEFDIVKYDLNPTIEFRNIINAIKDDIFVDELGGQFNKLFFVILNYIMSEQRMVDWAFKTSFVSVIHKLRKLEQYPNFIKDNQTFYEDYINEVKPYRTKIREYLIDYEGNDTGNVHPTDFDLPSYFDTDFNVWRSPSGEHARDALLLSTFPQYADWQANHTCVIESVAVINRGYGYSAAPKLTVVGGGGTGAVLQATLDIYLGSIIKIIVLNPGTGYTSTPTIVVDGDGINENGTQTAVLYPMLSNTKIRSFDTHLKFDRTSYSSDVKQWAPHSAYMKDEIVSYNNKSFRVIDHLCSGPDVGIDPVTGVYVITGVYVDPTKFETYTPTPTDVILEWYPYSAYLKGDVVRYTVWDLNPNRTSNSRTFYYYKAISGKLSSGTYFIVTDYVNLTAAGNEAEYALLNAADRVMASYAPTVGMPAKNLERLFTGTEYLGNDIDGTHYHHETINGIEYTVDNFGNLVEIDTLIESHYVGEDGVNPEDIGIVGGGYIDVYNSHAPEEFLPGMIYDTLDIKVFTLYNVNDPASYYPLGFRISKTLVDVNPTVFDVVITVVPNGIDGKATTRFDASSGIEVTTFDNNPNAWEFRRICAASTTTLARDLNIEDTAVYVTDVTALPEPAPWLAHPGVVYINGEKLTYYGVDLANNALTQIRRGTWGTGAPAKHIINSQVVDASLNQKIPGDAYNMNWQLFQGLPGVKLHESNTEQANFIKGCPSYLPWGPGDLGNYIDPNTHTTRFDDDGLDEYGTPTHPFDTDPWDSYIVT